MSSVKGSSPGKKNSVHVISRPLEVVSTVANEPSSPPVEDLIGQRRPHPSVVSPSSRRSVHEGILLKRCRLSWRERIVEIIRDTTELSGAKTSYQILIFDPRKRTLKDRIPMEDVVTIRSSCDCYFQIFLSHGKILQFKAENMDSQAYWMALIKVGLGRGSIFHVRVHTPQKGLEHALLYSIGVNLPAHRVGQLDRVLVLASPINDINIHAWDLNRVKHFMQLDVGIQMELCNHCVTSSLQGTSITFIMDKLFLEECLDFLCQEARISNQPLSENSLMVYPLNHTCSRSSPPPYSDATAMPMMEKKNTAADDPAKVLSSNIYTSHSDLHTHVVTSTSGGELNGSIVQQMTSVDPFQPTIPANNHGSDPPPPRNITRKNFESAMPAVAHPYMNFQPQIFQNVGSSNFESPYQISSRIIITNSGEVQYERNVLGNKPQHHGGFHFKSNLPLPPRSFNQTPDPSLSASEAPKTFAPIYPTIRSPTRTSSLPVSHPRREEQRFNKKFQKRASEVSDPDYVFIPDVVHDPSRVPLPQVSHHQGNPPPPSEINPGVSDNAPDHSLANMGAHFPLYVNYNRSNKGLNVQATIIEGINPSTEGISTTQYQTEEERNSVDDSSIQTPLQAPSPPTPHVQVSHVPSQKAKESSDIDSLSDSYEDIVAIVKQNSLHHTNNETGSSIHPKEVLKPHTSIPVSSSHDTVHTPFQPSFKHHRSISPNKPQAKPRRKKLLSESDSVRTDFHTVMPSVSEKSQTIPKAGTPLSEANLVYNLTSIQSTSAELPPAQFDTTTESIRTITNFDPSSEVVQSHTLDLSSKDDWSSSCSSANTDGSPMHITYTSTTQKHLLTSPPLTPPIPRPRPSRVGGVAQRTEDDSSVGRRRGSASHTLSTFIPVTDV